MGSKWILVHVGTGVTTCQDSDVPLEGYATRMACWCPKPGTSAVSVEPDPGNHHGMDGGPGDRDPIQGGLMAGKEAVM